MYPYDNNIMPGDQPDFASPLLKGRGGFLNSPNALALLGSYLMAAGSPSFDPGNRGKMLAAGMQSVLENQRQSQLDAQNAKMRDLQTQALTQQLNGTSPQFQFEKQRYADQQSRQDYNDVTAATDSVNQMLRQSRNDALQRKLASPEYLRQAAEARNVPNAALSPEAFDQQLKLRQASNADNSVTVVAPGSVVLDKTTKQPIYTAPNRPSQRALPTKAVNDLSDAGNVASTFQRLNEGFKPEYGGHFVLGEMSNTIGRMTGDSTGQTDWWSDYQAQKNVVRNKLFGSALTATEKAEFDKANIAPGMAPSIIKKNLERQAALADTAARKLAKAYAAAGYDKDAVEGALGTTLEALPNSPMPGYGAAPNADAEGWVTLPNGVRIREKR